MAAHQDAHAHGDNHAAHGSLGGYLIGFVLSAILTAIPFWLVMSDVLPKGATAAVVILFAFLQIAVHTFCFLHVNTRAEDGWTLLAFVFTGILVLIVISGSLWIMYHLHGNMMPMAPPPLTDPVAAASTAAG